MKVSISVPGRFHAFHLAKYLYEHDCLARLFTTYPKFEVTKYGIPPNLTSSKVILEAASRCIGKIPEKMRLGWNPQFFLTHSFDSWVAGTLIPGSEIFAGYAGASLKSLRRAKALGMKTILERSTCHMKMQQQLLTEEFEKVGMTFTQTHPRVIETELLEYEEADFISVPSEFVRDSFLQFGFPEKKILSVPLGVDLRSFSQGTSIHDGPFRVISCGTVSLQKGTRYLIEAFRKLSLPNAELWIVGSVTQEMQKFIALNAHPSIRMLGHQRQSDLVHLYRQCDLACVPSIQDGFAIVVPQAMACGLPVICTENTGAKDLVENGKTGFVVPIRDVAALADKIEWCYRNRLETGEMGERALNQVKHGFTWDDYGKKMHAEYSKILATSSSSTVTPRQLNPIDNHSHII